MPSTEGFTSATRDAEELEDILRATASGSDPKDDSDTGDGETDSDEELSERQDVDRETPETRVVRLSDLFVPVGSLDVRDAVLPVANPDSEFTAPEDRAAFVVSPDITPSTFGRVFNVESPHGGFYRSPLYFDDPALELCGQTHRCLTNARSAVCFFGRSALLPWLLLTEPPCTPVLSESDCTDKALSSCLCQRLTFRRAIPHDCSAHGPCEGCYR